MPDLQLTSPAFPDRGPIPDEYGYTASNANPPLAIEGIPEDTASLALVMDDPDAVEPAGKVWDHWVVWNIDPSTTRIPEDWGASGATEGQNDYGEHGYGGPNPPDREHTYRFRLYALEEELDLGPDTTKEELEATMEGLVLTEAALDGTYAP